MKESREINQFFGYRDLPNIDLMLENFERTVLIPPLVRYNSWRVAE